MTPFRPTPGSLVLYKSKRALVSGISDKIEIVLDDGKTKRVRDKDIQLLHPGPVARLTDISEPEGDIDEAWELLQGSETNLKELAELSYGDFTPSAAWSSWQRVAEGLHFTGTPDCIIARTEQAVSDDLRAREEKLARSCIGSGPQRQVSAAAAEPRRAAHPSGAGEPRGGAFLDNAHRALLNAPTCSGP